MPDLAPVCRRLPTAAGAGGAEAHFDLPTDNAQVPKAHIRRPAEPSVTPVTATPKAPKVDHDDKVTPDQIAQVEKAVENAVTKATSPRFE